MNLTRHNKLLWSHLRRYCELLYVLVARDLKVRYRGSFLGVYWSLLNPLIMTGLYTAIFGATFSAYYDDSTLNYILAAFTGLAVINFFSASTSQALVSIVDNGALLNKVSIPMSIFPLATVIANVFQFTVGMLPVLAVVTLVRSQSLIHTLFLIFPLFALSLICIGISFFVSTLYIFFRDLPYFYELVCFVAWISSPVFYPAEIVPAEVKIFLRLNPLYPIIESLRQVSLSGTLPDFALVAHCFLNGLIIILVGWYFFNSLKSGFMDLL